ncbi:MAG: hypothetical protein JW934_05720, partial [Anaerolineae bacterium]|nr:hypothetical protein [Anaerolineae bacterium]
GSSYLKIGWKWIKRALSKGWELVTRLRLSNDPDPEPAMALRKQQTRSKMPVFRTRVADFASVICL